MTAMTAVESVPDLHCAARCRPECWECWYRKEFIKTRPFAYALTSPRTHAALRNPGVLNVLNALPLLDALANATRHGAWRSPRKLRLFKRSGNNHGDGEASVLLRMPESLDMQRLMACFAEPRATWSPGICSASLELHQPDGKPCV